jgi:tripartite-type tricarboxylate transporter receptor subunit TctC
MRARWVAGVALLALVGVGYAGYAQTDFPSRRIRMVVPYPAGGIVDSFTRIITDRLSEIWQQPIVVEAMPGAAGNLAWDRVAHAEPDGYTLTSVTPATLANPHMHSNLRWGEKSLAPVSVSVWAPSVLVVHASFPANTVAKFIDYARKHPGALNWAQPGTGTSQHLNMAIFLDATKLDLVAVPYTGQPAGILDLMANRVQFMIASIGLVAGHVNSGALKALAVLGATRSPLLPSVPTMSEAGFPEINVVPWYGFVVPRATPQPLVVRIAAGFSATLKMPKVRELLEKQALQPADAMSTIEFARLYAADAERYSKVIRELGITMAEPVR